MTGVTQATFVFGGGSMCECMPGDTARPPDRRPDCPPLVVAYLLAWTTREGELKCHVAPFGVS